MDSGERKPSPRTSDKTSTAFSSDSDQSDQYCHDFDDLDIDERILAEIGTIGSTSYLKSRVNKLMQRNKMVDNIKKRR